VSSIRVILDQILSMPYYRNFQAVSGKVHNAACHEDAVENIFVINGYAESTTKKISTNTRDQWLAGNYDNQYEIMENNSYISQPCGTHNSPDFIVKDERGKLFFLECKSAKAGTPMYNSGVPKGSYIYVLSSEKHDATTLYMGKDCLPPEAKTAIEKHIREARLRDEELNLKLKGMTPYGITYYTRPMMQHKGQKTTKDYFLNGNRFLNEQNVFAHVQ